MREGHTGSPWDPFHSNAAVCVSSVRPCCPWQCWPTQSNNRAVWKHCDPWRGCSASGDWSSSSLRLRCQPPRCRAPKSASCDPRPIVASTFCAFDSLLLTEVDATAVFNMSLAAQLCCFSAAALSLPAALFCSAAAWVRVSHTGCVREYF